MATIAIANIDNEIIDDLKDALAAARSPALVVTGALSPDAAGDYDESGTQGGQTAYTKSGGGFHLWWDDAGGEWIISAAKGVKGAAYWSGESITGAYAAQGAASGAAAVAQGTLLFATVEIAGSAAEARQKDFARGPVAAVIYESTDEHKICDLKWGQVVNAAILLGVKAATAAARTAAITRLLNGARNAVAADPPADARAFAANGRLHRRAEWGTPEIDAQHNQPWATAILPLRIAYIADDATSH